MMNGWYNIINTHRINHLCTTKSEQTQEAFHWERINKLACTVSVEEVNNLPHITTYSY